MYKRYFSFSIFSCLSRSRLIELVQTENNNFSWLRLLAALLVLHSHSYAITQGRGAPDWLGIYIPHEYEGALGVKVFFIISGFLITRSFCTRRKITSFLWARFLRIYPAYWVSLVFSIILAGLTMPRSFGGVMWVNHIMAYCRETISAWKIGKGIPSAFAFNPIPEVLNGSLWTIPLELRMYVLTAFVGFLGLFSKKLWFNLYLIGTLLTIIWLYPQQLPSSWTPLVLEAAACFWLGSFFYVHRAQIYICPYLALGLSTVLVLGWQIPIMRWFYPCILSYLILFVALYPPLNLPFPKWLGDYSYGLYIYAWPIQQYVVWLIPEIYVANHFLVTFISTFCLAVISWHFLEKPLLKFKNCRWRSDTGNQQLG